MIYTRLDLTHSIGVLSRLMGNPGEDHWKALKHLMKYLKGTSNLSLVFRKNKGQHYKDTLILTILGIELIGDQFHPIFITYVELLQVGNHNFKRSLLCLRQRKNILLLLIL